MRKIVIVAALAALAAGSAAARDLEEILTSGKLVVGLRRTPTTYVVDQKTGVEGGFTWELASAFAAGLGLRLEVVTIPTFADLWTLDGKLPPGYDKDPALAYTPDLYRSVDFAADILSPLPWRERLVAMVPFIENTDIVLARKDLGLKSHRDLAGRRTFVVAGMASYASFTAKMKELGMPYVEEPVTVADLETEPRLVTAAGPTQPSARSGPVRLHVVPAGTPFKSFTGVWLIHSNQVDFGVSDYLTVLLQLWDNPSFRGSVVPAFSFSGAAQPLCFTLAKDRPRLAAELARFFAAAKADGRFSALVRKYTGFTYAEYLAVMGGKP